MRGDADTRGRALARAGDADGPAAAWDEEAEYDRWGSDRRQQICPARAGRAPSARNPEIGLSYRDARDPFSCSDGQISPW